MSGKSYKLLLISETALATKYGNAIHESFKKSNSEIIFYANDSNLLQSNQLNSNGVLAVLYKPETNWITIAEHGLLKKQQNDFYIHPIIGCKYKCLYCYLQTNQFKRSPLRFHVGIDDLFENIDSTIEQMEYSKFSSGELADSLADADIYPVATELIKYFGCKRNSHLELRTKSSNMNSILNIAHHGNTTISFSISPDESIHEFDISTPCLLERLKASRLCQDAGYTIAFNLEPIILIDNWEEKYSNMLKILSSIINTSKIEHFTLGCLRWNDKLFELNSFNKKMNIKENEIQRIEYRKDAYNNTYTFSKRKEIYSFLYRTINEVIGRVPTILSMEKDELI